MPKNEDQPQDENVEKTTPVEERDSEEADDDFESLFADDETQEDAPVSREEYNRLLKGTKKLATEFGRLKSQPKEEVKNDEPIKGTLNQGDDVSELFFAQIPKAELVSDDLKSIAELKYDGSILKAWKGESWLQNKASSLENAKKEEEVSKSKINKPTQGVPPSKLDIKKVKPEDVANLKPKEKIAWLKQQAQKEREDTE